jgi:hypothetical protein
MNGKLRRRKNELLFHCIEKGGMSLWGLLDGFTQRSGAVYHGFLNVFYDTRKNQIN